MELDYSDFIPEDVLEEVLEAEHRGRHRRGRLRLPSSRDLVEAVRDAALAARGVHPDEFPDLVYAILEERGFDTRYVTVKRIWRVYESLVVRGVVPDTLGVISYRGG